MAPFQLFVSLYPVCLSYNALIVTSLSSIDFEASRWDDGSKNSHAPRKNNTISVQIATASNGTDGLLLETIWDHNASVHAHQCRWIRVNADDWKNIFALLLNGQFVCTITGKIIAVDKPIVWIYHSDPEWKQGKRLCYHGHMEWMASKVEIKSSTFGVSSDETCGEEAENLALGY